MLVLMLLLVISLICEKANILDYSRVRLVSVDYLLDRLCLRLLNLYFDLLIGFRCDKIGLFI